jgi:putative peptidoglycan binding protein
VQRLLLGMASPAVGALHQTLLELGFVVAESELRQERFGASTMHAVTSFQRERGLVADGVAGEQTLTALRSPRLIKTEFIPTGWRCDIASVRGEVLPSINAAVKDIGTMEEPPGSNAGPLLARYRGHAPGEPWCAYWVSWALQHNAGGCPWVVLGSAFKILAWARARGRVLRPAEDAQPGDVWLRMRTNTHGHVALIVDGGEVLSTVEGNCGNAVRGRLRKREDATVIVRPVPLRPLVG